MRSGIILLDKPAGITSAKAIAKVKFKLGLEKIGHAGTLDQFATGLLVCLVGRATKLASYAESGEKTYSGVFDLGYATDSHDIEGSVVSESGELPTLDQIRSTIPQFIGRIQQTPPDVSAIKIKGRRASDRVRGGEVVEIPSREVNVSSFDFELLSEKRLSYKIVCSKGTYIRSIARDLGEQLGCGATVSELRRERSYPFDVKNARSLEELTESDLLSWAELFPTITTLEVEADEAERLVMGCQFSLQRLTSKCSSQLKGEGPVVYRRAADSRALGLLNFRNNQLSYLVNMGTS